MSARQTFEIWIDPALLDPYRLSVLMDKLADFSPILQDIGTILEAQLAENFETQGCGGWMALRASTLRDKARKGYGGQPALVREGALRAALSERDAPGHKFLVSASQVIVGVYGSVIPYASFLENGTGRMAGRILARITAGTQQKILDIITDWLGGGAAVRVIANAPIG